MLPPQIEGLQQQQYWDTDPRHEQKDNLDLFLARIQRLDDRAWGQEHIDEHVKKAGRLLANGEPVDRPLEDDGEDKVSKYGLEEDHARDEVAPNVDR